MGWKELLKEKDELKVLPWVGGRTLRSGPRAWAVSGKLPKEHGWHAFRLSERTATLAAKDEKELANETCVSPPGPLDYLITGYLVGDRLVPDGIRIDPDPTKIAESTETVHLVEPGLDRFARVSAGRTCEDGPLIYEGMAMPLGPEEEVLRAFQDSKASVADIKGVPPGLDAAFRMEVWRREEAEKRRKELERLREEEEKRLQAEEARKAAFERLGDGAGRRAMAVIDFEAAARAALAVGGAELLDSRVSAQRGEMVIWFRLDGRRFECTCQKETLRIVDAGICLVDHKTQEKGDAYFTLESLPGVIRQAQREGKLVVFRRADEGHGDDDDDYDD